MEAENNLRWHVQACTTGSLRALWGAILLPVFIEESLFLALKDSFKRTDAYNPDGSTYRAASFIPLIPDHR